MRLLQPLQAFHVQPRGHRVRRERAELQQLDEQAAEVLKRRPRQGATLVPRPRVERCLKVGDGLSTVRPVEHEERETEGAAARGNQPRRHPAYRGAHRHDRQILQPMAKRRQLHTGSGAGHGPNRAKSPSRLRQLIHQPGIERGGRFDVDHERHVRDRYGTSGKRL